jgi:hypothetical protein
LRRAALGALGIVLLACSSSGGADVTPSGSPSPAASNRAADLRTQLDLLLAEHVMIVAKESAAAVNHSDEYSSYTALLTTNSKDLTNLLGRAFGNTAATQLAQAWSIQNGYLVDYAIGIVTHNDAKANGAMSGLINGFVPQFAQLITDASQLPLDSVTQLMKQQMLEDKAFIDDVFAQRYPAFYKDVHTGYTQTSRFGDALAAQIAQKYPDKFPGDPAVPTVDARVTLNLLLQEHSYLETMATDAVAAGRSTEKTAATAAMATNADKLRAAGPGSGSGFEQAWAARDAALLAYASGEAASKPALTDTFVHEFAALWQVDRAPVKTQIDATIKVIDDQRAKGVKSLAADDRAAATAMQPIGDSVVQR